MANAQVARTAALFQCKSCETEKPATEFYASNQSRCKECVKASVRANRYEKADYYRAYDRKRYRDDPARAARCHEAGAEWLRKNKRPPLDPLKRKARNAVNNGLRDGTIERSPCFFCGSEDRLQAHHHDYALPLDIYWLCSSCHGKLHTINGDMRRAF